MSEIESFWASNLSFLRQRKGLSQDALAESLGLKRSKIAAHESGQTRNPTAADLLMFSEYFGISINNLLGKQMDRLAPQQVEDLLAGNDIYTTGRKLRVVTTVVDPQQGGPLIELIGEKARAGYLSGYADPEFLAGLPAFSLPQLSREKKYRMFQIKGDSMLPLPEGTYIIGAYLDDWSGLQKETPCIVVTQEEGIVFKMTRFGEGRFVLRSLNALYPPMTVAAARVVEVWKFASYISDELPAAPGDLAEVQRMMTEIRTELRALGGSRAKPEPGDA